MKPRWEVTAVVAIASMVLGYGIGRSNRPSSSSMDILSVTPSDQSHLDNKPSIQTGSSEYFPTKGSSIGSNATQSENQIQKKIASPKNKQEASGILKSFIVSTPLLERFMDPNWDRGVVLEKGTYEGSETAKEQLPDGAVAERYYRKDGSLLRESITYPDGEKFHRAFFENGKIKSLTQVKGDRGQTSWMFDSGGFITQRTIALSDGTLFSTQYDDHGNAMETYWIQPNGAAGVKL